MEALLIEELQNHCGRNLRQSTNFMGHQGHQDGGTNTGDAYIWVSLSKVANLEVPNLEVPRPGVPRLEYLNWGFPVQKKGDTVNMKLLLVSIDSKVTIYSLHFT